jgi:arginyl-tRNA synthetase
MVHLTRGGEATKMSKRRGDVVFLDAFIEEIGIDAARWYLVSRGHDQTIAIGVELAEEKSAKNPVYYVQYAHARIASILRKAADAGLAPATGVEGTLAGVPEAALARAIVRFPEVVEDAVAAEETHGITAYATELATTFHGFYRDARVVDPDEPGRSAARLALADAARITLANAVAMLGISAPESM